MGFLRGLTGECRLMNWFLFEVIANASDTKNIIDMIFFFLIKKFLWFFSSCSVVCSAASSKALYQIGKCKQNHRASNYTLRFIVFIVIICLQWNLLFPSNFPFKYKITLKTNGITYLNAMYSYDANVLRNKFSQI